VASLVEELLVGMKKEDACYTRLLELSENKRQAIIAGAVADLEEVKPDLILSVFLTLALYKLCHPAKSPTPASNSCLVYAN
jgi:hypothetical protein